MSHSIELADAAEALQTQVDSLLVELERQHEIRHRLIWAHNGRCHFCHADKPHHLPRCYARLVLYPEHVTHTAGSSYGPQAGIQPPTESIKKGVVL
jgi:hypothetical protein